MASLVQLRFLFAIWFTILPVFGNSATSLRPPTMGFLPGVVHAKLLRRKFTHLSSRRISQWFSTRCTAPSKKKLCSLQMRASAPLQLSFPHGLILVPAQALEQTQVCNIGSVQSKSMSGNAPASVEGLPLTEDCVHVWVVEATRFDELSPAVRVIRPSCMPYPEA
jgi:hypothetical protein